MKRVYVAGPIHGSGTQASNIHAATQVAMHLVNGGCAPFVPHYWFALEIALGNVDQELFMRLDHEWLAQCHAMIRIPGKSPGADREEQWAREMGLPVFSDVWSFFHALNEGKLERAPVAPEEHYLDRLQREIGEWEGRQPFHESTADHMLLGIVEELGELARSVLKTYHGIRGTAEQHERKGKDAIGDIFVYAASYCRKRGWTIRECIESAWAEVKERDWAKYPENGRSASNGV